MTPTPAPIPASTPTPAPHTFRLRSAEDLIAVAPILLGFHPRDDVVMLTVDGDRMFHGRLALPARADPATADAVAAQLLCPAAHHRIRTVAFLFFSDDVRVVQQAWRALRRGCHRSRIHVVDALRVHGGRFHPLRGDRLLRDRGVPYDVSSHPFRAEASVLGIVIERDRDALAATTAPDPAARATTQEALEREGLVGAPPPGDGADRRLWGGWLQRVVRAHVEAGTAATPPEVARMVWATQDVRVRDAAWSLIRRAEAERHQDFWRDVVRRTPDRYLPAPAALLGWSAWQAGHGALAWIAVDRCREVDPGYTMAAILADCLERAVPPDLLDGSFAWDEGLPA